MGSRMPRIGRHIVRACDGMDSERTQRKRDAGLQYARDTEDRTGIGENGGGGRGLRGGVSRDGTVECDLTRKHPVTQAPRVCQRHRRQRGGKRKGVD
jgi:hypothetical protein